jgi:hypothetical protein
MQEGVRGSGVQGGSEGLAWLKARKTFGDVTISSSRVS